MVNEEFDRIYETYHQSLFQYLFYLVKNRDTAEELVQEVYIKVFQSYSGFEGKSSEKTWLYSVARHVVLTGSVSKIGRNASGLAYSLWLQRKRLKIHLHSQMKS